MTIYWNGSNVYKREYIYKTMPMKITRERKRFPKCLEGCEERKWLSREEKDGSTEERIFQCVERRGKGAFNPEQGSRLYLQSSVPLLPPESQQPIFGRDCFHIFAAERKVTCCAFFVIVTVKVAENPFEESF